MTPAATADAEIEAGRATLPTGADYIASLDDHRAVYLDGERVRNIAHHPAFRNSIRSIARLYDALQGERAAELIVPCDTESTRPTHAFFLAARSADDLRAAQRAIAGWARLTYGWMGRTPDYKASLTTTLGANADFFGPYADNARRWYAHAQQHLPFLGHAVVNPPIDRHLPVDDTRDIAVRVVRETDAGIVVSGAKVVATSAAIANHCFIGQTPNTAADDPDMATSFIAKLETPGIALICRNSYELAARSPFESPLAARFDENDAIITFNEALIPWEDVLIHRDPERVAQFFPRSGFVNQFLFHGCTRLAVKLDFIAGLLAKALRVTGGHTSRSKRALLGEVIAHRHAFWSLSNAMASTPDPWTDGFVLPNHDAALAYCVLAPDAYPRVRAIVHQIVASGLIYLPASAADLDHPDTAPLLARYARGSEGIEHRDRTKIMKLLWDAVGTEFAGRHELYERNYAGGWECIRLMVEASARGRRKLDAMEALVDQCLADYDEQGWINDNWIHDHPSTAAA